MVTDQQKVVDMVHEVLSDGGTEKDVELAMASSLVDGLRHGNWPWDIRRSRTGDVIKASVGEAEVYVQTVGELVPNGDGTYRLE